MTLVLISTVSSSKCISLKNQECNVSKVIVDKQYMAYPYKIRVNRCVGSCNDINNPHSKVCIPDITKNVTVKMFDLIKLTNKTKQVIFHESCRCICRLDPIVYNNKQRWNKNKCRCECLINKKCDDDFVWNISNCELSTKKAAKLTTEECEEIIDDTATIPQNKTILIKEFVENCKPFVASSILFVSVLIILIGIVVYFCVKSRNKDVLPY